MDGSVTDRVRLISGLAASHFGKDVVAVTPLKDSPFSSVRIQFSDEAVIASQRRSFRRTHLEALVLEQLSPVCDDVPAYLGMTDGILFQSDLGGIRLDKEVMGHDRADQLELAAEACASIFRFQAAARQTGVGRLVPKIGTTQEWMENLVCSVDALQLFSSGIPDSFDYQAVADKMTVTHWAFVKWHCRPSYAVICDDGFLRWNGFELSGTRHGAEDLAWLLGDESWPLAPEDLIQVVKDTYDQTSGVPFDDYAEYLAIYTALHCVQRFKLIIMDAQEHGWHCEMENTHKEHPGVDPVFASQLCQVGAFMADRSQLTRALVPNFELTARTIGTISGS
ncbi:hypothetical protein KMP13_08645 [Epibacterium ulvae]|uniref:hypothetical protein n=1 Tax=Epibacterium ulvae TaxID=1156985 RepID=UPI001BFC79EC|nr:hypothetical protein [Epibacterium ulvae]MBT8153964.1 hypothetical protein [Epibacterium ulvae]